MKYSSTFSWLIVSGLIFCLPAVVQAQNVKVIADREAARRQAHIPRGEEVLARAQAELHAKQYAQAHEDFRAALRYLPDSPAAGKSYSAALDGFCESGVKLAEQRIAEGKYEESEVILNEILSDPYNPNCREARTLLTHLHDPGYINKTMGPKFLAKVEEVKKLLTEAEGFYQSGRYDMAMKRYDQVLNLDPYNTAARKGQERIDNTKYQYGVQAYNETRGRAMWQVEHGWEQPVRQYGTGAGPIESHGRARCPVIRRVSATNSIASLFRGSNFAMPVFAKPLIFCASRRRRTILQRKDVAESILFCAYIHLAARASPRR